MLMAMMSLVGDSRTCFELSKVLIRAKNNMTMIRSDNKKLQSAFLGISTPAGSICENLLPFLKVNIKWKCKFKWTDILTIANNNPDNYIANFKNRMFFLPCEGRLWGGDSAEGKISRKKCCSRHDFEVLKTGANIAENGGEKISQAAITGELGGFLPL